MSYDNNPYDHPEKHGLTKIKEIDYGSSYEFDIFIVWQHNDGSLYYASDSGCSCPSPFEGYNTVSDLTRITKEPYAEFMTELTEHGYDVGMDADKNELAAKVWALLNTDPAQTKYTIGAAKPPMKGVEKTGICIGGPHHGHPVVVEGVEFKVTRPLINTMSIRSPGESLPSPGVKANSFEQGTYVFATIPVAGEDAAPIWIWKGWE